MSEEVIRGRIRVDARRAVEKLRDHQLVDLHHYTHELARAAVASGAERIDVEYDADDVIVRWQGEPIPSGVVGRLLDHVLTEADDAAGRRLRLLAMGVNAALGLSPVFVDLHAVDAAGLCRRARWTPALLKREDDIEQEEVPAPDGLGPGGTRVHVRRRFGWDVLRRATLGGVPREVASLQSVAAHLPAKLMIAGEPQVDPRGRTVVSAPLRLERGLAPGLAGRLEILTGSDGSPTLVFVEQGIEVVRYDLDPSPMFPAEPFGDLHLPVRVVVAAEQLPTNASRSAIREGSSLADEVLEAARLALGEAVDGLVARWEGGEELPVGVRVSADAQACEHALGAFVSVVAAAARRGASLGAESRRLLELPILLDGMGKPTSYAALAGARATAREGPIYLHRGEPLPEALSPWMRDVVLVRAGRLAEAALGAFDHRDAAPLVKHAMEGVERREVFLAHAPTEVVVPPSSEHVVVETFEVTEGRFSGLSGEVALCAVPSGRTTVRVFYERRELAVQHLSPAASPLPLDVALAWDERIRVRFGFDGVEDDRALRSAIWYAMRLGVGLVRRVIADKRDDERIVADPGRTAAWVRAAMRVQLEAWACLELPEGFRRHVGPHDALRRVAAWPTVEGRYATTDALAALVEQRSALCYVEPAADPGRPVDGRVVLVADEGDRGVVGDLVAREVVWVPYERGLAANDAAKEERRQQALEAALEARGRLHRQAYGADLGVALAFGRPGVVGLVAPALRAERVVLHAGQELTAGLFARRFGPVVIVVDDETVVPAPDWQGVAWSGKTWAPPSVERELLVTLMAALEGDMGAQRALGGELSPASLGVVGRSYLAQSFAALEQELNEETDEAKASELVHLSARAVDLPICRMAGADGRARWVSTGAVLDAHGTQGPIPALKAEPGFASHDWYPLIVEDDSERAALREWFGGRLAPADRLLSARRERAAAQTRRLEFLSRPPIEPFELGELAPGASWLGKYEGSEGSACVALRPTATSSTVVDVAYRLRPALRDTWLTYPLPVVARVSLEADEAFHSDFRGITTTGASLARQLVALAAADLVRTRLANDEEEALRDEAFVSLVAELFGPAGLENTLLVGNLLKQAAHWPTVQGGTCRLPEARRGKGEIYVGRARYEPWREGDRPGALDRAVIHVGSGPLAKLHERILAELKIDRRDVSDAVEALQRRRAAGADASPPSLGGSPPHPALRCKLEELGRVRDLSGEIELVDGPPRLVVGDLSGPARDATTHPTAPVHAVVWSETVASEERDARIAKRIDRLALRLMVKVAETMAKGEELPAFVALVLRSEIGSRLASGNEIEPALREAAVFVDTEGRWHSLAELEALKGRQKPIWATDGEPPYPERDDGRVILRLAEHERMWLRKALPLRNMTSVLERTAEGQRRREAAPVAELRLGPERREACLWSRVVSEGGLDGEIGILAPESQSLRGVEVHVGRRPLCRLDDRPGWPICAVVDDDDLRPNPFFDGPRQTGDGERSVARVRALAEALLERVIEAPERAPASRFIRAADEGGRLRVTGRLWLQTDVGARPSVVVIAAGAKTGRAEVPLVRLQGPEGLDRTVPVCGTLLVEHAPADEGERIDLQALVASMGGRDAAERAGGDASHHYLSELALQAAAAMVDELRETLDERDHDRLVWTLALLEAPLSEPPMARGTEGEVAASAILAELTERQAIWITRSRGYVEGNFPGTPPRFALAADDNPGLLAALEERSLRPLVRELGGEVESRRARSRGQLSGSEAPIAQVLPELTEPHEPLVDPLFSGLVSTVRGWFGSAVPAPVTTTLRGALEGAIAGLRLPGDPVLSVGFSRRGRPIRYQKSDKRLVINRDHPAIVALVPVEEAMTQEGRRLFLAAVVSELNRAHEAVTAAAELEALRYLLESESV